MPYRIDHCEWYYSSVYNVKKDTSCIQMSYAMLPFTVGKLECQKASTYVCSNRLVSEEYEILWRLLMLKMMLIRL